MYKAIFIDIDGTLRNNKKEISTRNKSAIKNITNKGVLVVLCSGRPRKYTENLSRDCNASRYIIVSNGGAIYNYETKKVLYEDCMDKDACIKLYKMAEQVDANFIMNVGDYRVVNKLQRFDGSEMEMPNNVENFIKENNIVQCVIADENFEKIKKLKPEIEKINKVSIKNQHKSLTNKNILPTGKIYYDIANEDSSKGKAIKQFCKILNIDLKDVVAIGDSYNDIPMFKVAGHSVAMKNANEEVKKEADEITGSNEEDGVAMFLEKLGK